MLGELLPRAGLRYYSISSSSKEEPNKVSLTAVLVRYAISTPSSKKGVKKLSTVIKQGLATSWFERLHEAKVADPIESPPISPDQIIPRPKYHIPIYIRTSNFKLPKSHSVPVVMVGPGTGVAPFRGFVRERFFEAKKDTRVGPTWLFYGCRHEDQVNHCFVLYEILWLTIL